MSISNFQYTAQFLLSIERTVSKERLKRYLAATQQDTVKALELYEHNVALAEALYGYLHGLEVAIRNAIHHALTRGYNTPYWYDQAPLSFYHQDKFIKQAKLDAGSNASAGKVIAELMFGFWTDLVSNSYHWSLWVPHLSQAFPNATIPRKNVHKRLQTIRWLRNRIAHHEPILTSGNQIYAGHQQFITLADLNECAEWICLDTAGWLRTKFRYQQAGVILTQVNATGLTLY